MAKETAVVHVESEVAEVHKVVAEVMPYAENLARAIEKGMDTGTISKLMDLQERWEANQAKKAFVDAMAGFKRECPAVIGKDRKADFGAGRAKYSYATTGAIVTAITPALSKFGLSLSWETKQEGKSVTVTCHVTHAAGHRESAMLTGPYDESGGKNPIQTLGSSVHYLQRYTLVSVLGLATADMDDPDQNPQRPPVSMPTAKPTTPTPPPPAGNTEGQLDCPVVTGTIEKFIPKGEIVSGKERKSYSVKVAGEWYSTLHDSLGSKIADLANSEGPVDVKWSQDGKFRVLEDIRASGQESEAGK